jgi:P pilus assembly/Cpx signaling pathway, periplasmic inhibitor/zinc-resistance associated protein
MSKKLLIAALALACVGSLGFAGENRRPDKPEGGPQMRREMRDQRGGPRWGSDGRGHHGDWMRNRGDRGGPRHMGMGKGSHFGPGMGMRGHGMGFLRDIDLTADQQAKFIDIMTDNYRKTLELRLAAHGAQRKAFDIRKSDAASSEEIIALNRQMGELRGKFEAANRELRDQLKAILTPEQAAKLDDFRNGRPSPRFGDKRFGGPRHHWYDDNDVDDTDDIIDMEDGE